MRTIKFRGKSKRTGEWLYGDLVRNVEGAFAVVPPFEMNTRNKCSTYEVDEKTVGQFTGMQDKNSKEIYEGDILLDGYAKYEVWYSEDKAGFIAEIIDPQNNLVDYLGGYDTEQIMTVIGNIHDNPELLKGGR